MGGAGEVLPFWSLVLISCAIDGLVFGAALLWPWEKHLEDATEPVISVARFVLGAVLSGALFLFKLPVLVFLGLDLFGLVHVVYVDLVVVLPLLGLATLIEARRSRGKRLTRGGALVSLLLLTGAPVGVWATFVEPFRLQLEVVTVPARSPGETPREKLRIGVLADLQTARITDYEREAIRRLLAEKPDVILIPGDLYQGPREAFEERREDFRQLLASLEAPGGVFAVRGNVDSGDEFAALVEGTGIRVVENEVEGVEVRGRRLQIFGRPPAPSPDRPLKRQEEAEPDGTTRIVLSHYPDPVYDLSTQTRIDLLVAGHTHGGQICVPFFGPITVLSRVPRRVGAGGLHEIDGRRLYVSRGVGCERDQAPRIRWFCPPEITILELE